ncbi:MAG TPA: hypothetical protein VNE83_06825 [Terriglobales bacterium]|nr:hypothetical protein [Terriglobales bacterium]
MILVVASLVVGAVFGVWSTLAGWSLADAVNAKLPPDRQFGLLGWHAVKSRRLVVEYRRLYPDGILDRRRQGSMALHCLCF